MIREFFPSEQEQADTYRKQIEAFSPRPVTMRTLDIGAIKRCLTSRLMKRILSLVGAVFG